MVLAGVIPAHRHANGSFDLKRLGDAIHSTAKLFAAPLRSSAQLLGDVGPIGAANAAVRDLPDLWFHELVGPIEQISVDDLLIRPRAFVGWCRPRIRQTASA